MTEHFNESGVWFVYDGECPMCHAAAQAMRIKQKFGTLHLIDARTSLQHPLVQEVTSRQLDLDDGMVIYHNNHFYHGCTALTFMARHGEVRNSFTAFCKSLFWSDGLAWLFYPWLRGTRNLLLKRKWIGRIDNLARSERPIFADIFGAAWSTLPPVMQQHYANRPYSDDVYTVEGKLDVFCAKPLRLLLRPFAFLKSLPPYMEDNVPTVVSFRSDLNTRRFHFDRTLHFKGRKPYRFLSYMEHLSNGEVIETTRTRIGWRMQFEWADGKVLMQHKGFVLNLFGHYIPLPLEILLGRVTAEEVPVDDHSFDMRMSMDHPRWGKVYGYQGRFTLVRAQ